MKGTADMLKFAIMVPFLFLLSVGSSAQQILPEYGDFSELRGKRTVYIMSEDFEARKAIVNQVEEYVRKSKVDAKVVGTTDEAEIIILYGNAGVHGTFGGYQLRGELAVCVRGEAVSNTEAGVGGQKYRLRILYTTRKSTSYSSYGIRASKSAHKKAIRDFLDKWSKFQKEKK
jgi:hypothetical protein